MPITRSIVLPCYNEAPNLPLLLKRYEEVLKGSQDTELILVDNGSTDATDAALKELLPRYPFARSTRVPVNRGYGHGILHGFKEAQGDLLVWTHADMQTDPGDAVKALALLAESGAPEKTFVKGRRIRRAWREKFFTLGMGMIESALFHCWLTEINAQPNAFHKSFLESWTDPPHDFSLDIYALVMAKKNGLKFIRFDVLFPKRIHGSSHWDFGFVAKMKHIKKILDYSFKLRKRLST